MGKEFLEKKPKGVKAVFLEKKSTKLQPTFKLNIIKNSIQLLTESLEVRLLTQEHHPVRH